jgi:hypothetical protein
VRILLNLISTKVILFIDYLLFPFSSARLTSRKKGVKFLLEKEEEKITPQPPSKKMKTSAPEQGAQIASKPTAPLRARKSAALSSKRFWQADSDLGEFFKYKSDKGKVSRRTTKPQPFSFMLREEQKKKAREAKEQAAKQNMVSDGDIVFCY